MGRFLLIVGACLSLCACDEMSIPASDTAASDCAANASAPWRPLSGAEFRVTAASTGADCASANASITVSDASGRALYTETFQAAHVMVLAPAENATAMQAALSDWIDQTSSTLRTASELPVWIEGADSPVAGEFPFYPESGFDRAAYEALRQRDAPLFCFVQGMESMACLALENGVLTKVGVQSFPG